MRERKLSSDAWNVRKVFSRVKKPVACYKLVLVCVTSSSETLVLRRNDADFIYTTFAEPERTLHTHVKHGGKRDRLLLHCIPDTSRRRFRSTTCISHLRTERPVSVFLLRENSDRGYSQGYPAIGSDLLIAGDAASLSVQRRRKNPTSFSLPPLFPLWPTLCKDNASSGFSGRAFLNWRAMLTRKRLFFGYLELCFCCTCF